MEEVGGEMRRGRGRGEDGRGEGRVWGRSACGTVCRASHWEGVRGREKGEGEGGRGTGSERGQHSVREHRRRESQKYHVSDRNHIVLIKHDMVNIELPIPPPWYPW